MTAKLEDLDSLSFSEVKNLLKRICKVLGFRLSYKPFYSQPTWLLDVDDDTVVFLDGHDRDEFLSAKDLLRGIIAVKAFKVRHISSFEEQTIQNPLYGLDLSALKIKLDLLA